MSAGPSRDCGDLLRDLRAINFRYGLNDVILELYSMDLRWSASWKEENTMVVE